VKLLIVDQFDGPSPYQLQQQPMKFDDLVEMKLLQEKEHPNMFRPTRLIDKPEGFTVPHCTTVWREGEDGNAVVFGLNWDSSD